MVIEVGWLRFKELCRLRDTQEATVRISKAVFCRRAPLQVVDQDIVKWAALLLSQILKKHRYILKCSIRVLRNHVQFNSSGPVTSVMGECDTQEIFTLIKMYPAHYVPFAYACVYRSDQRSWELWWV